MLTPTLWAQTWPPPRIHPVAHLATSLPSAQARKICGAASVIATITTIAPSHCAASQPSPQPRETLGPKPTTATTTFDPRTRRHLVLIHPHSSCQSRSLKWSATHKESRPRNPSCIPHTLRATTRHPPLFNSLRPPHSSCQSRSLKQSATHKESHP